jgi:SAM-dependent methyltransferase
VNHPIQQHQTELQRNQAAWANKSILREIYAEFYRRILTLVDARAPGRILELGSGIGGLRSHLPGALLSDLFPNTWLDLAADAYELPFLDRSLSHLILFDVFHHLRGPKVFLKEAHRVLGPNGRLILFEPFISWTSYLAYGLFHHEPVGWNEGINLADALPRPRDYYAAQGNATRIFFRKENPALLDGWSLFHAEAFAATSYLLSGGFSKPCLYPARFLPWLRRIDRLLSLWSKCFGARCLVGLTPK